MLLEQITDEDSLAYQRTSWEALKGSINGLINKVYISNVSVISQDQELLQENRQRPAGQVLQSSLLFMRLCRLLSTQNPQIVEN